MKTIQVRRARHARHCWRSRDELISCILLWTPSNGRAKVGRPARTGCSLEDQPGAMDDREEWEERVREIHAGGVTWWWWSRTLVGVGELLLCREAVVVFYSPSQLGNGITESQTFSLKNTNLFSLSLFLSFLVFLFFLFPLSFSFFLFLSFIFLPIFVSS